MKNLWYGTAVSVVSFCGVFVSAEALRSNGNVDYSVWVTGVIVIICIICGLFKVRFPDLARRRPPTLGQHELVQIKKISDESEYTRAQKQPLYKFYLDRRIQISGIMVDLREWTGSSSRMTVRTNVGDFTAFMSFSDRSTYDQHLIMLAPGAHVTATGQIKEIECASIVLVNCEIVPEGSGRSPVV
jgi:putative nucleic acid binding protein